MAKTGWKTLSVLVLAVAVLAGQVLAGPARRGPRGVAALSPGMRGPQGGAGLVSANVAAEASHPMMPRWMLRGLDLTDEQIEAIKQILEANKEAFQATQKAVAEAAKALRVAVPTGDEGQIRTAATNLGSAIGQRALPGVVTLRNCLLVKSC